MFNVVNMGLDFSKILREYLAKVEKADDEIQRHTYFLGCKERIQLVTDFLTRVDTKYRRINAIPQRFGTKPFYDWKGIGEFKEDINDLIENYEEHRDEITEYLGLLDEEECERIAEAYYTLSEACYASSVVNSAVALEKRLWLILKRRSTATLKRIQPNLRFTLGALIEVYLQNKQEFKNCIPKKYEFLLKMINSYRIISSHPKELKIQPNEADSIFNLTIQFLLDSECQPPKKRSKKKT